MFLSYFSEILFALVCLIEGLSLNVLLIRCSILHFDTRRWFVIVEEKNDSLKVFFMHSRFILTLIAQILLYMKPCIDT